MGSSTSDVELVSLTVCQTLLPTLLFWSKSKLNIPQKHRETSLSVAGDVEDINRDTTIAQQPPGDLIVLDPAGDMIIHVFARSDGANQRYLISSSTISLASSAFQNMVRNVPTTAAHPMGRQLRSRTRQQESERAEFDYRTDHPECVDMILRALHHQLNAGQSEASAVDLATFALTCQEFDCCQALIPWAELWAAQAPVVTPYEVGCLLLVAHLMGSESIKLRVLREVKFLPLRATLEWAKNETLQALPMTETRTLTNIIFESRHDADLLVDPIITKVHDTVNGLLREVHNSIENMRASASHPVIKCRNCDKIKNDVLRTCCGTFNYAITTCYTKSSLVFV